MPRLRSDRDRQVDTAIEELIALAQGASGVVVGRSRGDRVTVSVGAQEWPATVIARTAVSLGDAQELTVTETLGSKIIVANQLSGDAKEVFARENSASENFEWSWLDRRGELQLNHPNASGVIHFDAITLESNLARPGTRGLASPRSDGPIRGRAGISYAAAVLLDPTGRPSIRAVARLAEMSHGAVGDAAKLLRDTGLIRPDGEPEIPDLFDALAEAWGATRLAPVASVPTRTDADRLGGNVQDLDALGWGLGGDEAALAWGAPMFAAGSRPWIWVPTDADARRATRSLDAAPWDNSAAVIAVTPTLLACQTRLRSPAAASASWLPTVHPLFLALELAQDPGRGREILDGWNPDHPGIQRVW